MILSKNRFDSNRKSRITDHKSEAWQNLILKHALSVISYPHLFLQPLCDLLGTLAAATNTASKMMPIAGPSRLITRAARSASRTTPSSIRLPRQLRLLSRSTLSAKPLTAPTEVSPGTLQPYMAESAALTSNLASHQRARQRISDIDAQLEPPSPSHFLRDRYSRQHTYLRISLTEKCNLRCLYCMPEDGVPLTPHANLLSTSEVQRLATLFVSQGVNKIRLTGGEPTIRSDLPQIVTSLNTLKQHGLEQIGITTNGIALGRRKLDTLVNNGLTHLNVSLDTLDPFKFEFMTRRRGHQAVMDCIERALALGVSSVKINVVVIKGLNDTKDVADFVRYTKDKPITIRFIEVCSLPPFCIHRL